MYMQWKLIFLVLPVPHCPRLETVENTMKLGQMVVQGLWENKSPLLQLPHISEPMLRHFVTKRVLSFMFINLDLCKLH